VPSAPRLGVVGATGAVGTVTLELLAERGYDNVRAFASERSAGSRVAFGGEALVVEEATPDALAAGDLDLVLFSIGTSGSRELVPHAVRGGAVVVDKSSAYRLQDGVPLVVPEVNGARALQHDGIVANPNCCTIPLSCVLKPLEDAARLRRVRVSTYQSVSGAGTQAMDRLEGESPREHDLRMDWDFDGVEFDEESKLREETRKIMELPELPISATCVRVPVMVGHAEAVWLETEEPLSAEQARELLAAAPSVRVVDFPSPGRAAGGDDVLVGRIRPDPTEENGLVLFLASDNLRKGAALNAIQIAELVLAPLAARRKRPVSPVGPLP
jgi:aspartate-semialdehyde dehydrogenase